MYDGFYAQDAQRKSVAGESLFATQPGGGATIYAVWNFTGTLVIVLSQLNNGWRVICLLK